ncbi:MAG: ferrochelatase [Deferribacteraceae bacterium]|jgi:ferrochelatase|nr:ferrochelatase [Deferribacteraceae bacterium]
MQDAVIALGMGGPDSISAIEPFLKNLLTDREIIDFGIGDKLQRFIAGRIATKRSAKVAPNYEKMGGGSPQLAHSKALLDKAAQLYLEGTGIELDVYIGMCYWHPFIEDSMKALLAEDSRNPYRRVYLLPLYPQYSIVTSGAAFNRVHKIMALTAPKGTVCRISQFHTFEPYLLCLADRIKKAAKKLGLPMSEIHLMFSAHATPKAIADKGDPYVSQLKEQVSKLVELTQPATHSLAYQSKLGKQEWLTPSSLNEIKTLASSGIKNIIVLAISFVNDHIETLIELDEELQTYGESLGLRIVRAESLNSSNDFAIAVAELLRTA